MTLCMAGWRVRDLSEDLVEPPAFDADLVDLGVDTAERGTDL